MQEKKPPPPTLDVPPDTYDSPWKDVLELYLKEFFELFFPQMHDDIDWTFRPVNLDKELRKIARDAEVGNRFADKLFQLRSKGGRPFELMTNVEVQGSPEASFAERLFVYNYRTYDRFHRPVVSIAVLCDDTDSFHPQSFYACDLWDCQVGIKFPTVKLRRYNDRWDELEASSNPFATVVMAHLKTQATRGRPRRRYRWKLHLIRRLYDQGYERKDIVELFRFIDWVMALPQELEQRLDQDIETFESERKMKYVSGIERRAMQRGLEQGIQQGMEKGIQQGIEQGMEQERVRLLKRLLGRAFGELPPELEQRLTTASRDEIDQWVDRVPSAGSLDEVFAAD